MDEHCDFLISWWSKKSAHGFLKSLNILSLVRCQTAWAAQNRIRAGARCSQMTQSTSATSGCLWTENGSASRWAKYTRPDHLPCTGSGHPWARKVVPYLKSTFGYMANVSSKAWKPGATVSLHRFNLKVHWCLVRLWNLHHFLFSFCFLKGWLSASILSKHRSWRLGPFRTLGKCCR